MTSHINQAFNPFPVIETKRLILRNLNSGDRISVFNIFSDPEVTKYYDVKTMKQTTEASKLIEWWQKRIKKRIALRWAITYKSEDRLLGTCGFSHFDKPNNLAEIGIDIIRSAWGQGIGTETICAVVDFGFRVMQLNRIETWVTVENKASIHILKKTGFRTEGILRNRRFWQGQYQDVEMLALLQHEYFVLNSAKLH